MTPQSQRMSDYRFYTQQYDRPGTEADRFNVGTASLAVGAKILQDVQNKELYVVDHFFKKHYLTKNGNPLWNASGIMTLAKGYGKGPAVAYLGDPLNPTIKMWSADDETEGGWQTIDIKNQDDLYFATKRTYKTRDSYKENSAGFAAINPFSERPRDVWSGVADFNRGLDNIAATFVVPALEMGVDDVLPGFSQVMDVTGATNALQEGLTKAMKSSYGKNQKHTSGKEFDLGITNVLKDPRIKIMYRQMMAASAQHDDQTIKDIMRLDDKTNAQKITKMRALLVQNQRVFADDAEKQLLNNSTALQGILGDKTKFDFSQINVGLATATNPEQRLRVISYFNTQFKNQLLPLLSQTPKSGAEPPESNTETKKLVQHPTESVKDPENRLVINGDQQIKQDEHGNIV